MPRKFYGIKRTKDDRWVIVNKEGCIVSKNGYPLNINLPNNDSYTDVFGCSTYTGYLEEEAASKQADEWDRSFLIFEKPAMTKRELFILAFSRIDWFLFVFSIWVVTWVVTSR